MTPSKVEKSDLGFYQVESSPYVDAYGISRPERELITGVFFDAKGVRHEYAYTAVGFAHERVDAMLNPPRERLSEKE